MLSGLIELMEPLGSNSRAVRTSVFRLMQEDWLAATPVGRRSEYSLTPAGQRRIKHADTRIYDMPQAPWNGTWQLLLFPEGAISQEARENLRRELLWEGFAPLAPGVYAHPSADTGRIQEVLAAHKAQAKIAHLTAASLQDQSPTPLRDIVRHSWRLDEIADGYRRFIAHFEPMLDWAESAGDAHSQQLFLLRTLLIHEFRRVQLRDPQLPDTLLATNWPGHTARALCKRIYEIALPGSEDYLCRTLQTKDGPLPPADNSLLQRFQILQAT